MTDQVDVAALRAIISRYRRAMIERDAASACKRAGDMLDASHRAAEAARDMMNAAPSLLAEVERLRALVVDVAYVLSSGRGLAADLHWEDRAKAAHAKLAPVADLIEGRAALAAQEQR